MTGKKLQRLLACLLAVLLLSQVGAFLPAARARYADYPYLLEAIETRHDRYNIQRMHLWKYEREGRALVVAPQKPVEVGHVEHDPAKLLDLYIQGRQEAKRLLAEIQEFVER